MNKILGVVLCWIGMVHASTDVFEYLPKDSVEASVMGSSIDPMAELEKNLSKQSMKNFQLRPSEDAFVEKSKMKLTVLQKEDGTLQLKTDPTSAIDNLQLDPKTLKVLFSDGKQLTMFNEISIGQLPVIGHWEGIRWVQDPIDFDKINIFQLESLSISIGKISNEKGEKRSIHYQQTNINRKDIKQEDLLLLYD